MSCSIVFLTHAIILLLMYCARADRNGNDATRYYGRLQVSQVRNQQGRQTQLLRPRRQLVRQVWRCRRLKIRSYVGRWHAGLQKECSSGQRGTGKRHAIRGGTDQGIPYTNHPTAGGDSFYLAVRHSRQKNKKCSNDEQSLSPIELALV